MQIHLVGGAVRDQLLGRPVSERDWVVVGAAPEQMLAQGFRPVGRDFPVFLHPDTGEEYALARTERKQGHGYHGFAFDAAPGVTLEEDLARRDLTINAMALAPDGRLTDPYGGQRDLQARLLRHVSPAFVEDPLRVLRVARFAARYRGLGFRIAPETLALMRRIAGDGELQHLVPERVWKETERALMEDAPQVYIQTLRECGALAVLLPELDALFGVPQAPRHHPEIDSGVHTLLALAHAAGTGASSAVRWAVLLHDLGKGLTPSGEWPRHIAHEPRSARLARQVSARLKVPREHAELAALVAEYHTHSHRALELRSSTLLKLLEALDHFRRPGRLEDFLAACEADARGRTGLELRPYRQAALIRRAAEAARRVEARPLAERGLAGEALGKAIRCARSDAIAGAIHTFRSSTP